MWLLLWWMLAPRVFLIYSQSDTAGAARIDRQLTAAGCVVWRDRAQLAAGDKWAKEIERAMDSASIVLVLVGSPCETCRDEIARAIRTRRRVVPFLLRPDAEIPLQLEQRLFLERPESLCTALGLR